MGEVLRHRGQGKQGLYRIETDAYTALANEPVRDFRQSPDDKSNMAKYLFGGFDRCLYPVQKFQSDAERKLAIIVDRDVQRWFKPAKGQFQIFYLSHGDHLEYQPDFVAEGESAVYMAEPKASNMLQDPEVLAKRDAAVAWCKHASKHAASYHGKPWQYLLIPHDIIAVNMTLAGLAEQYAVVG